MAYKNDFGQSGEDRAAWLIESKGFQIVERNFRYKKSGEIDVIARKDDLVIFVEVKNRSSDHFGGALYSISNSKKRAIRFVAEQFLNSNPKYYAKEITCRFDMVAIEDGETSWIEDIFR